ncbi:hypothetical protein [Lentzea pudingi]|uniref:hypothetical protein n=1 Tax=Lentzea pudingi TaxID=1789439 RepID=UPI0016685965|nr:hypothetical protein [Lentzea pudingi]
MNPSFLEKNRRYRGKSVIFERADRTAVELADLVTVAQLGSRVSPQGLRQDGDWQPIIAGLDLDDGPHDFGADLNATTYEGPAGRWAGSALDCAALVYKRACRWDFPPGEAGVSLLMLAPTRAVGGDEP